MGIESKNIPQYRWMQLTRNGVMSNYLKLIVYCYHELKDISFVKPPIENFRRNLLKKKMSQYKNDFGIIFNISSESGESDEFGNDTGRMDICCYISTCDDEYIAFECKRFLNKEMISSYFRDQYVGQGLNRFKNNSYSPKMDVGGMIAFAESGDFLKLDKLFNKELPIYSIGNSIRELSDDYEHSYIYCADHHRDSNSNIRLTHVLLDFTHASK